MGLWCKGPRALGEWTRSFFKDIVSAGGVRLKEEKIMKYLDNKYGNE